MQRLISFAIVLLRCAARETSENFKNEKKKFLPFVRDSISGFFARQIDVLTIAPRSRLNIISL